MFGIGDFSKMTNLSIKSLRLYHEKGILMPSMVDEFTGYRYYDEKNYETARAIKILKRFDFSLTEIKQILEGYKDESDIVEHLEKKREEIQSKITRFAEISRSIEDIIKRERGVATETYREFEIEEKKIETMLIAGYRMKGRYEETGKGFQILGKAVGRFIVGKPMSLFYDHEYKEEDADFEPCFPVRKGMDSPGISVRELPGGKCVSLIHKGPYEKLGDSYKKIFGHINEKGWKAKVPTREVFIKGPGLILKGNPKNYLTELQILIEE